MIIPVTVKLFYGITTKGSSLNRLIKMGEKMRYVWTALLVAFLSGCIPYSDNPLSEPSSESHDSAILGTWFVHDDSETLFIHIGKAGNTKKLRLTMIEFDRDGEVKTSELSGHTSRLGEKTYLNLQWAHPAKQETGYLFVKYTITGSRFGIALIKVKPVKKAIQEGQLQGEIIQGDRTSSVKLTESSERLRAFFEKHDIDLFEQMKYLNRLDLSKGAHSSGAEADPGEVLVSKKPEYSETVYSLSEGNCEMHLTVYGSELKKGVVHARSKCSMSLERQIALFKKILEKILEDEEQAQAFHTLFWGRLEPDVSHGTREMSFRLALAAHKSPLWDKKRGQSKKGHENYLVVELANKADIYRELKQVLAAFGRLVRFSSAEKVLIVEAEKLPFFEALKKHGVQAKDRLPFDCLTWFSVSKTTVNPN